MPTENATEMSLVNAVRMLDISLERGYRLVWSNKLKARKSTDGRWLVCAASVAARLARLKTRNTHTAPAHSRSVADSAAA